MNQRLKDEYKLDWLSVHGVYERQLYRIYKNALDRQIKEVVKSINEDGLDTAMMLLPILISPEIMENAYLKAYELVGVRHGKWVTDWMTKLEKPQKNRFGIHSRKLLAFGSEFWRRKMRDFLLLFGAEKVVEVDSTTIQRIRQLLIKYQSEGLSVIDQARQIVKELNNPAYNKNRSLTIARTESTTAANYTALEAGKEANYLTQKEWLAIEDNRTRPSHAIANGQQVDPDEPFLVGGENLMFPGDPQASPKNLVNCRCSILITPILDPDGLPIRK